MSTAHRSAPGTTRSCPHCRATILESATVCPACKHHLRFDSGGGAQVKAVPALSPLRIEGTIRHPTDSPPWEYSMMVSIKNERGEEIARKIVGVGALNPGDVRTFSLSVEVFTPANAPAVPENLKRR